MLGVPLLREGDADRRIPDCRDASCGRSPISRSSWLTTFADQAVIAIENVRLFDEVQARTRDLSEFAGAADRDLGGTARHLQLARRTRAGVPYHYGEGDAHLRGRVRQFDIVRGRRIQTRRSVQRAASFGRVVEARPDYPCGHEESPCPHGRNEAADTYGRHQDGAGLYRARAIVYGARRSGRRSNGDHRTDAEGQRADRRDRHLPPGGPAVHPEADRPA